MPNADSTIISSIRDLLDQLEAAEQPKPCATISLPESASELPHCSCGYTGWPTPSCSGCGKPLSAEAHQPPASDVPECPFRPLQLVPVTDRSVADLIAWGTATRAACVRIAHERDAAKRNANEVHERFMQAASERDEAAARNEGILLDMQTLLHERDEARRELEAERAGRPGSINAMTITSLRERLAEAEAELAALKGQEPFGWWWIEDGIMHEPSRTRFTKNCAGAPRNAVALYAAPVPPPDTLHDKSVLQLMQDCERLAKECDKAKAQHDAEVAQARREALHEAEALVNDIHRRAFEPEAMAMLFDAADAIRALAEKGGERK